ncbi:MAG: hypothetical protein LBG80_05195, partial [Bacteroidales bacterium]|nr:hypothetical protein [Bacteroidales bacterium]
TLFEGCFKTLDGPDAPDLAFRELDKTIVFHITNAESSNNYKESYRELDYSIPENRVKMYDSSYYDWVYRIKFDTVVRTSTGQRDSIVSIIAGDSTYEKLAITKYDTIPYEQSYVFEGYQVFQLVNENVGPDELSDVSKAQLVYQCDIKNGIKQIINYEYDARVATEVPVSKVEGNDVGIKHSFTVTEDKFGGALVNHKKYYYMAIAYGYNNYEQYATSSDNPDGLYGQKMPYLQGRENTRIYTVIPHIPAVENGGLIAQSVYGSQPQITQLEGQGNGGFALQLEQQTIDEILKNNKADSLIFKRNHGPIGVKVVDPLKMVGADFTLRFYNPDGSTDAVTKDTRWELIYGDSVIRSDTSIFVQNEQMQGHYENEQFVLDLGLSITIFDARFSPLDDFVVSDNPNAYILYSSVDFISSTVEFTNSARPWLSGVTDEDGQTALNWVRGGTTKDGEGKYSGSIFIHPHSQKRKEDYYYPLLGTDAKGITNGGKDSYVLYYDKSKQFGKVSDGSSSIIWAPYALASMYDNNPGYGFPKRESLSDTTWENERFILGDQPLLMTELYSVYIVLTSDKDLWTRCPVVEISDDISSSIGGAIRHDLRKSPSVNKEGKPDVNGGTGMGWFPGYAICLETGERLNMMFGENSSLPTHNGMDMLFNPTPTIVDPSGYVMGGGHYVYVMGHRDLFVRNSNYGVEDVPESPLVCPAYDEGKWLQRQFEVAETDKTRKHYIYKNVMWTTIPLSNTYEWLEKGNDVKMTVCVSRPYQKWSSAKNTGVANPRNNNMPLYRFSTKDLATIYTQRQVAASYMDSIYVTPNPYYGMNTGYETSQLDTRIRFVNLPNKCRIKIFSMDGTLIRMIDKDDVTTYAEWDLKNAANIPIASGMYLIHVRDEEYNTEKTLKFLCIQRPVDVNAF